MPRVLRALLLVLLWIIVLGGGFVAFWIRDANLLSWRNRPPGRFLLPRLRRPWAAVALPPAIEREIDPSAGAHAPAHAGVHAQVHVAVHAQVHVRED